MKKKKTTRNRKRRVQKRKPYPSEQVLDLPYDIDEKNIRTSTYTITEDAIPNKDIEAMPEKDKEKIEILRQMVFSDPEKAIPRLKRMMKKYPHIPIWSNFLISAYSNAGDEKMAFRVSKESCKIYPDYLFAKLNYAEFCLRKNKLDKIKEVLKHFDLKMLYPERDVFHISEVAGFMGIAGRYYAKKGNIHSAELCYKVLKNIAPEHNHTKILKKNLHPTFFQKILKKLL